MPKRLKSSFRSFVRYRDLIAAFLLTLVALCVGSNVLSPVRFDREKIEIRADGGQVHVRGLYHYRNRLPFPLSFSLGLPFPVDAAHLAPSDYSVSECSEDGSAIQEISTHKYHGNVVFRIWLAQSREKWIRVDYTQPILASNARYILLTTQKWHSPLDRGQYTLHLPGGDELVSSNYDLQYSVHGQTITYGFARTNFLPNQDWVFSWKPSGGLASATQGSK